MDGTRPLYRNRRPKPANLPTRPNDKGTDFIDLSDVHLQPFGSTVADAAARFDDRAAAAIRAAVGGINGDGTPFEKLLEVKTFGDKAPTARIPTAQCLAVAAYPDFFPSAHDDSSREMVSNAILAANPGWCGSFGPGADGTLDVIGSKRQEGNYDMSQMHLLQIAYRCYDQLTPEAQERLITVLLATGRIRRPNQDDIVTSGGAPNDWSRAGFIEIPNLLGIHIKVKRIGETENHILTIHTARYLTNQLLYQRDHDPNHDNRRNNFNGAPSCTDLMLALLRNILRDDFSEYNAKNYQTETRYALLNLCSYAYDHEVRLAARMVLDYVSARIAVSSNDLRRMVPFRRRNENKNVTLDGNGYMDISLVETTSGADPMSQHFAILAGNTRIYEKRGGNGGVGKDGVPHDPVRPEWHITTKAGNGFTDGNDAVMYALSDYRLPPSIHDLFVNDLHRRFYQRLHRVPQDDPDVTGRNCENHEIYAGSPSYLITAGGSPSTYAIDPHFAGVVVGDQSQQLGVAVPTSFMPTSRPELGYCGDSYSSQDLIQFSRFSDEPEEIFNYGVAPDFVCGHRMHSPFWCKHPKNGGGDVHGHFRFVNKGSDGDGPGFYLAIYDEGNGVAMEAFDTWLHPNVLTFEEFKAAVLERNGNLNLSINIEAEYTTQNGNHLRFLIWDDGKGPGKAGATILSIKYGTGDPQDSEGDAGNITDKFLRGTVLNSREEGVVEITNHFLDQKITLDMKDQAHPMRTSETDDVEEAGANHEVWVDFDWKGPNEGDFFHPFNTIAGAAATVASGGVIKIMPGITSERSTIGKRVRLVAPSGGVRLGFR